MAEINLSPAQLVNDIDRTSGLPSTGYANQNKFIAYVPLANILGSQYSNLELNVTRWTMPPMTIGSSSVQFKGYTLEIPTYVVNAETKELTITYLVREDWADYASLYSWAQAIGVFVPLTPQGKTANELNQSALITSGVFDKMCDIHIWLLSHFKKRLLEFKFENCWIKRFDEIAMDYANTDPITHSFTIAYSDFVVQRPSV